MTPRQEDILAQLSPVQQQAVTHRDGPVVVFSGAGSGKTRIITSRIAYLIESGCDPRRILAVTFTNRAAGEMRERVAGLTPMARGTMVATFHAACARWLREFAPELGYTADFSIYDDSDSTAVLKAVMQRFVSTAPTAQDVSAAKRCLGWAKTNGLLAGEIDAVAAEHEAHFPSGMVRIYKEYQTALADANAMDFGDLILNTILLLRRNDLVREVLGNRFRHILVDEYQDANRTQVELISRLGDGGAEVFVVGDDDQSIYSWRGAAPWNILSFEDVFAGASRIVLDQNYRCSGNIVKAAGTMVGNNATRAPKELWTDNEEGDLIRYTVEADAEFEAMAVAETIAEERRVFPFRDIAVFYRTNSQSRLLEDALRLQDIPYRIYGSTRFYDRVEVKDVLAYLRLLVNPRDNVSFRRAVNTPPRKIGGKSLEQLDLSARSAGTSLMEEAARLAAGDTTLGRRLGPFVTLIERLREAATGMLLPQILEAVLTETAYVDYLRKKYPEQLDDKQANIQELKVAMDEFVQATGAGLAEWLQGVTLSSQDEDATGGVSLMTLHMAKGLEFERVYIVGLEEGLLPHSGSRDSNERLEEERRLLYVGMTRARRRLTLLGAFRRRTYQGWVANRPSRFLSEIPKACLDMPAPAAPATWESTYDVSGARYEYDGDECEETIVVNTGMAVEHRTYGRGKVCEVLHEFGRPKVVVDFFDFGLRKVNPTQLDLET